MAIDEWKNNVMGTGRSVPIIPFSLSILVQEDFSVPNDCGRFPICGHELRNRALERGAILGYTEAKYILDAFKRGNPLPKRLEDIQKRGCPIIFPGTQEEHREGGRDEEFLYAIQYRPDECFWYLSTIPMHTSIPSNACLLTVQPSLADLAKQSAMLDHTATTLRHTHDVIDRELLQAVQYLGLPIYELGEELHCGYWRTGYQWLTTENRRFGDWTNLEVVKKFAPDQPKVFGDFVLVAKTIEFDKANGHKIVTHAAFVAKNDVRLE